MALTWLRGQWNEPSRSDYYLMQLTSVQLVGGGKYLDEYRIPFVDVVPKQRWLDKSRLPDCPIKPMTAESIAEVKRQWKREGLKI